MANEITSVTRRNIYDEIILSRIWPFGRFEEHDFLDRIFVLHDLPSNDHRFNNAYDDIRQHRVINCNDWDDHWILSDSRINLLYCEDSTFLQFLCETIHPMVRNDESEVQRLLQLCNDHLKADGYQISEKSKISGKPVFGGTKGLASSASIKERSEEIKEKLAAEYVHQQISIMEETIDSAPHVAIGTAKELVETCCKSILEEKGIPCNDTWKLMKLLRETTKTLKLTPEDIPDSANAASSIKQILGSLSAVVQGIAELRNHYGSGHGKDGKFIGLKSRHAKLAVGAASTLAMFLLETLDARKVDER